MRRRPAFTLIELLVVIGIIALLIGILLPALSAAMRQARHAKTLAAMREMMHGYALYQLDHKDGIMLGYPPAYVAGNSLSVLLPTGQRIPTAGAGPYGSTAVSIMRYPARFAPYHQNVWKILYNHKDPGDLPLETDTIDQAAAKIYSLSLYPTFGLNSTFMGGDTAEQGFIGILPNERPNAGKHVAFKATEVTRPSEQIVFAETIQYTAMGPTDAGYFRLTPPITADGRQWYVENETFKVDRGVQFGMPHGRNVKKSVVTGFFDGHAAGLPPQDLQNMRLWASKAASATYKYDVD